MNSVPYRAHRNTLSAEFVNGSDRVSTYYSYISKRPDAYIARNVRMEKPERQKADRTRLVSVLEEYNLRIHNSPKAMESIRALLRPETLVIIGGQQAGLLTGPVLVMYKAITIIQEAKKASAALGKPVVPVFWIAGEDHDMNEVNHIQVLNPQGKFEKLSLDSRIQALEGVSHVSISQDDWNEVMEKLEAYLIDTEFKSQLVGKLREIHQQSGTLSDAFARTMAWLFAEHGLVLMDAADPNIRALERPMFRELLEQHEALNEMIVKQGEALVRDGFPLQAEPAEHQVNLFMRSGGRRKLLQYEDGRFQDKQGTESWTKEELLTFIEEHPERFSNNVFTRPLMQEFLFPVLGTVLGPAEIAYWGLLKPAFEHLDMEMPVLIPRTEITFVESTVQKHLDKYELTAEDVMERYEEKLQAWLKDQDHIDIEGQFHRVRDEFIRLYRPVVESLKQIQPGMNQLGNTNMEKILEQIVFLENKAKKALIDRHGTAMRQWEKMYASLKPMGKYQERVYNVFVYLNKYGMQWLEDLIRWDADDEVHYLMYV
ncbi:bacillithiol biosynthesis cysteine-adding enzyme BshC [Marinicrinis lubricantis]|uniref:Putative cysteine ligase BshC n=1 Tax=Marinicrinis lubricantis TaxID=2086470 RepID=A0ABW1ISI4_9BACL